MGADGSERLIAPSKICSSPDFSAVLVKADGQTLLSQGARNAPEQTLINRSSEQGLGSLHINPEHWDVHRVPLRVGGFPSLNHNSSHLNFSFRFIQQTKSIHLEGELRAIVAR